MKNAFRRKLCFCLFAGLILNSSLTASAQVSAEAILRLAIGRRAEAPRMPEIAPGDFRPLILPLFRYDLLPPPLLLPTDAAGLLQNAIVKRLGVRYRYYG